MKTILLVEDNPEEVDLALRAFRINRVPAGIVVTRDGVEALEWLTATGSHAERDPTITPSLVLLDLQMPRMDGLQVLDRLRRNEQLAKLPVVVMTTSREDSDVAAAYRLGANSFVNKPVDFDEFLEVTRQLGAYWLGLNQTA